MLLFTPSKPLRDRFLRIFGPSRQPKPRISLDRVNVFEVFTIFSSHSLFALSSGLLRPIFGSSGHLLASSRAHFSWPKLPPPAQKGRLRNTPPPFLTYMCPSSPPTSQMVPPEPPKRPQNLPKSTPKCAPKAPNYVSTELLHSHSSFLLLNYFVLLTKYYLLSTKYLFPSSFLLLTYSFLLSKYYLLKY